jgi:L-lactate dehydrogenase
VRAVVRDEKRIFMVAVPAAAEYGIGDVVLSLPCVVGRAGAERQLLLNLSEDERRLLRRSAEVLDTAYRSLTAAGT